MIFGDYCIIEENVKILNQKRTDAQGNPVKRTMRIGNYNMFEVGAQIDSTDIGDLNEFGVKSQIQRGCTIGSHCKINPTVIVPQRTKLESNSVVIGNGFIRIDTEPLLDIKKTQMKEMSAALSSLLPKHNSMRTIGPGGVLSMDEPSASG
jgi:dynactin-6